jgi:hypothetical protein
LCQYSLILTLIIEIHVPRQDTDRSCIQNIGHVVGTVPNYTTLSEQLQDKPRCRNSSKLYRIVGTVPKYTTLSELFQNIPRCRNSSKIHSKNIERYKIIHPAHIHDRSFSCLGTCISIISVRIKLYWHKPRL